MKRMAARILMLLLLAVLLSACSQPSKPAGNSINVICTTFPQYDWVRQILGGRADHVNLTLLLNNKIDLHNYQPSVDDIVKISSCDLFVYIGGESDGWVGAVLKNAINEDMIILNLVDMLGDSAKEEELLEGMEGEAEENNEADYDEHVWLSIKNTTILCPIIADALSSLDAGNAAEYQKNLIAYIEKLQALDAEYQAATNMASVKTLLFGDRFPFRYMMDDYGLTPYAAFSGCSAETEASFDTVIFLAKKADELNLNYVMVTESSDQSIARTISSNTSSKNQKILVLNAMQSVTTSDVQNGATYLSIMESNLEVLKEALQ